MKNKLLPSCSAWILTGLILGTSPGFAATTISDPLTQAQFQSLTASPPANYGTPDPATFADGPFTVSSGTGAELFGGTPSAPAATTVLLVLSATNTDVATLGNITLSFDSAIGSPVTFASTDFFTTAQTGFPTNVMSIANGAVNGISFPTALHAAADITFPSAVAAGADLGTVTITSPIALRVDVFGDIFSSTAGHDIIVGNAANSGALGIAPIPEPSPMALFGVATIGLMGVMVVRHRRHHCTSA